MKIKFESELYDYDESSLATQIISGIIDKMTDDLRGTVEEKIMGKIDDLVFERITAMVDETLSAGIRPISHWGEPIGEAKPLRDVVKEKLQAEFNRKVDSDGRPTTSSYGNQYTLIEWAAKCLAQKEIEAIKKAVAAQVKEALGKEITESITKQVSEAVIKAMAK